MPGIGDLGHRTVAGRRARFGRLCANIYVALNVIVARSRRVFIVGSLAVLVKPSAICGVELYANASSPCEAKEIDAG